MRKLVVMRGAPGSGKSTLLREAGLSDWSLSADTIRGILGSPILTPEGRMIVDQDRNVQVFDLLKRIAEERMSRGETLAVDMTHERVDDMLPILRLAVAHRYEVACVDLSGFPEGAAVARDDDRPEHHRVGERRIRKFYERMAADPTPTNMGMHLIPWIEGKGPDATSRLLGWLAEPILDFSNLSEVVHVGDLQGCLSVLIDDSGPIPGGSLRDDVAYVFVGDLLDRGIENGRLLRWFHDVAIDRPNVFLLWGNHEDHLARWTAGREHVSAEFEKRTLPQLIEAGIDVAQADRVLAKARDFITYRFRGAMVMVTHAGLSTVPRRPELISLRQYSHGTGYYEDPVDEQFERNAPAIWHQVHGHRNHRSVPTRATPRSFNLEDSVEFGGTLRTATLSADGWTTHAYRNAVFRPIRERLALERKVSEARRRERRIHPSWISTAPIPTVLDENLLSSMRVHKGVNERTSVAFPHVASLSFSKNVFFERSWDDVVVKARSLFFHTGSRQIVARGYEKFFNIGERDETSLGSLRETLRFPVSVYVKENGFLGNVGYDVETDSLFVASKSTPDGKFAEMFREILLSSLDEGRLEFLRRYLRDMEASITFEVIDPVRDPHIIEYERPQAILLDVLRRTSDFERASFGVVEALGDRLGIAHKERAMSLRNWDALAGWLRASTERLDYRYAGRNVEGFVVEGADGFMTKVKLPYYGLWKQMRSMKDRMLAARQKERPFSYEHTRRPDGSAPVPEEGGIAHAFRDWCLSLDDEELSSDIISLRRSFMVAGHEPIHPVKGIR